MTKLKSLLAGAVIAALAGLAWAQVGIAPTSFTGNEAWSCAIGGPQGPSMFCTSAMLRNTTGGVAVTATTGTITWPGVPSTSGAQYSRLVYTGAVGTATQNLPATPFDGQTVELINGQASTWTALTVAVTDGSTTVGFGPALALAAGASAEFYYLKSTNSWYRIR